MLQDETLFGIDDKVENAINLIRDYEPLTQGKGFYLAFSGGKDSVTIKALADMAGVKYDAHYNWTTIDPPEVMKFIKEKYPDVIIERPKISLLRNMVQKGVPPLRNLRWCCAEYKERGGKGRFVLTGVRRAESQRRAKRRIVEPCYKDSAKFFIHPIINWSDDDVWEFIHTYNIPYCELYDKGWQRIGCIFCPFGSVETRKMQLEYYPKFKHAFILAFEKLYQKLAQCGRDYLIKDFKNGEEMFMNWVSCPFQGETNSNDNEGQYNIFE